MHGLFENAIYGGRIDNTFDAKVLLSYLLQYFEQAVFPGQVSWPQNSYSLLLTYLTEPSWTMLFILSKVIFTGLEILDITNVLF